MLDAKRTGEVEVVGYGEPKSLSDQGGQISYRGRIDDRVDGKVPYLPKDGKSLPFTVCLGIAVDDTIHFLSRYVEEQEETTDHLLAIERSFPAVGTGMIMTTIVLVAGFSSVLTSDTRAHRIFATLSVITLVSALVCDLIMLPPLLAYFDRKKK